MKTANPSSMRSRIFLWIGFFLIGLMTISNGQQKPAATQDNGERAGKAEKGFKIGVRVEEVRLDAVVMDPKGHQITDLTADDFEIRQDGKLQEITSCTYINDYQPMPKIQTSTSGNIKAISAMGAQELAREDVRRTIAFVVDNFSMNFVQVDNARMALRKFIENQMQSGDLVSIVPTAGGIAALQVFSSDKRYLLSMVGNLRWFPDVRTTPSRPQFMAVSYYVRALRDMPGRKSLIVMSPQTMIPSPLVTNIGSFASALQPAASFSEDSLNPLADAALRAGVVIHTLSIQGLEGPQVYDHEFGAQRGFAVDSSVSDIGQYIIGRNKIIHESIAIRNTETPIPLSKKTGGLFVRDFNFFVNGTGVVNEALKGYYMLTYIPPADTFKIRKDPRDAYRRIKVKVKRPGSEVHTRDGFFGISQAADMAAEDAGSLRGAIFSPFRYNDLNINLASGFIYDAQKGYQLQSWLHLDAKDLSFVEAKDKKNSVSVDAACVTSDINNFIQDSSAQRYEFSINRENIPWVREHGLRFSLMLPVKKPGAYYVRAAVKELESGKIGSAYQFIEIPDLKEGRLSLSNIFLINRDEDAPWAQSGTPQESGNVLYPDMRRDPRKSPALRSYLPGEDFECAAMIYNAEAGKGEKPDLESQYILFGNGKELFRSEPKAVDLAGVSDYKRIPVKKKLTLGNAIRPGDYVLLLQVKDKKAQPKRSLAAQSLDFKVLAK